MLLFFLTVKKQRNHKMNENNFNHFFNVRLEFGTSNKNRQVTEEYVLNNIVYGLKTLFGEVGASCPIEILKLNSNNNESDKPMDSEYNIILMCPSDFTVKLRASLTLHGSYQGERCAYHVIKTADSLLSLI